MTKEQENYFFMSIQFLNGHELIALRKMVDEQIEYAKHLKDNFYLNDSIDDYIYIVRYNDESYHYVFIGSEAYNEFTGSDDAVLLERKTKELFPTYEILMSKENHEEKGLRSELPQKQAKANQIQSKQGKRQRYPLVS